jgi:hypothetical protein
LLPDSVSNDSNVSAIGPQIVHFFWCKTNGLEASQVVQVELLHLGLASQVERERTVLADEANMRHLARHEILQIYEIRQAPPW